MKLLSLLLLVFSLGFGQGLQFEVATVKPSSPDGNGVIPKALAAAALPDQIRFQGGPGSQNPGRIDYSGVTLKSMIERAYSLRSNQVFGPGWMESERYDVTATVPDSATQDDVRLMLQSLLRERFQLEFHREQRKTQVYLLTVAKGGPKLQPPIVEIQYQDASERMAAMRARMEADMAKMKDRMASGARFSSFGHDRGSMANLVETLSRLADRPVKDATELPGTFSFRVEYVPAGAQSDGPSIYAAVEEQLGLRLQPVDETADVLIVDRASKTPAEN